MRRAARRSIRLQCRRGALGLGPNLALGVINISETGAQFTVKELIATGAEVEVSLEGYGMRQPIRRIGQVRWVGPIENGSYRVGVHFDKLLSFRDLQSLVSP